jgi:hypothetical protein
MPLGIRALRNSQALDAVLDARGAEVGNFVDRGALGQGGGRSANGEEGGSGELHFDGGILRLIGLAVDGSMEVQE